MEEGIIFFGIPNSKAHHKEKLIKSDKKIICPLYENIHANDYSAAE